jgi:hypothetical protein
VAEAQVLSKAYRKAAKYKRIPAAVLWLVGFAFTAKAQQPAYSADSLISAFDKGSRVSLKGTEVVVRDVVAETRISKVIFKSSQNDRVICELGPSTQHHKQAAVGSALTVKGRIRGRGLLGNVTLDDCNVAAIEEPTATASAESTVTPDTVPQEAASAEPDEISDRGETLPPASAPDRPRSISAPRAAVVPRPAEQAPSVATAPDNAGNSIEPSSSDSRRQVPYSFYALLILSGAIASLILSKLLAPATRVSRPPERENTAEARQAALQALLLKTEKKK